MMDRVRLGNNVYRFNETKVALMMEARRSIMNTRQHLSTAPSSPGRKMVAMNSDDKGFYFSEPASPTHHSRDNSMAGALNLEQSFEFEVSWRKQDDHQRHRDQDLLHYAEELFFNGQIRPMNNVNSSSSAASTPKGEQNGQTPRAQSPSPPRPSRVLRNFIWDASEDRSELHHRSAIKEQEEKRKSRSLKTNPKGGGVFSNRWVAIKELLYVNRSSSEGRAETRQKDNSFSPAKQAHKHSLPTANNNNKSSSSQPNGKKPGRRNVQRSPVAAPLEFQHYAGAGKNRSEEMRRKSFLPYRMDVLGCLGFRRPPTTAVCTPASRFATRIRI